MGELGTRLPLLHTSSDLGRLHTRALHVQIRGTQSRLESHRRMHGLQ